LSVVAGEFSGRESERERELCEERGARSEELPCDEESDFTYPGMRRRI
jgi:hypothetical protein